MAETEGFKQVLRPWLVDKLNQSFPDPSAFAGAVDPKEAFLYAALTASIFKKVIAEILRVVDMKVEEAKALEEKKKSRTKDPFEIGA